MPTAFGAARGSASGGGARALVSPKSPQRGSRVAFRTAPGQKNFMLSGTTRDLGGVALGSCVVSVYRTFDDAFLGEVTSNADGKFNIAVADGTLTYYLVAYKAGTTDVMGATVNTLTPTGS